MRDTWEAMEAAEYEDEVEAQQAVLKLLDETQRLEEALGPKGEARAAKMIAMEASGVSVADLVEGTVSGEPINAQPSPGPAANRARAVELGRAKVPKVVVCGFQGGPVASALSARLREEAADKGGAEPVVVDLSAAGGQSASELEEALAGCDVAVVCPEVQEGGTEGCLKAALQGMKAVLAATPPELTRVLLLSQLAAKPSEGAFDLGAMFGFGQPPQKDEWEELEKELTSTARRRTSKRALCPLIVRTPGPLLPAQDSGDAAGVTCSPLEAGVEGTAAPVAAGTAAEALLQAVTLGANSSFSVARRTGGATAPAAAEVWPELLAPFVGPEVWRTEVPDARRAAVFVQQWAAEFFAEGKRASRFGVKTPVGLQRTPAGVVLKFEPPGEAVQAGGGAFDSLSEGGLEFVAEQLESGEQRLRVLRCAYGFKVSVREASEQALLTKFSSDWNEMELARS